MPTSAVKLTPGVDTLKTPALNEAGISASNLIRFREGLPEKLGGWVRFYPNPMPSPARSLWPWQDLSGIKHLAVGSATQLAVITNAALTDITPTVATSNGATFATTNGSAIVTVTDPGSQTTPYDKINLVTPVAVGGLVLQGLYAVTTVDANSYKITAVANATSTSSVSSVPSFTTTAGQFAVVVTLPMHGLSAGSTFVVRPALIVGGIMLSGFYTVVSVPDTGHFTINAQNAASANDAQSLNGGQAQIVRYTVKLPGGLPLGYGQGGYGLGGYGTGVTGSTALGSPLTTTDWSLANYGETLVGCPVNGPIFQWSPSGGFTSASLNVAAPAFNAGILVAEAQQMIVAWGSSVLGQQDPLLIRWCDTGNPTQWTAAGGAQANQAGSYRLPTGSRIVGAVNYSANQILVWTDVDLWLMSYIGYPYVWSFNKVASGCGLIASKAFVVLGEAVFWMSQRQFWAYRGGAEPMPCPVLDSVFPVLDLSALAVIRGAGNSYFNEARWFYPVRGGAPVDSDYSPSLQGSVSTSAAPTTGENSRYVCYNAVQQTWDIGILPRSAWVDQSTIGPPIGCDATNMLVQHEVGNNAIDVAMQPSITTGYFMLSQSEDMNYVDYVHPDIKFGASGTVQLTLYSLDEAFDTPRAHGPYTITPTTRGIALNIRARLLSMQFASADVGSAWRLGNMRFRYAPNGRR